MSLQKDVDSECLKILKRTRAKVEEAEQYIKIFPERRNEVCKGIKRLVNLTLEVLELAEFERVQKPKV